MLSLFLYGGSQSFFFSSIFLAFSFAPDIRNLIANNQ
jgi:hypothetical protein